MKNESMRGKLIAPAMVLSFLLVAFVPLTLDSEGVSADEGDGIPYYRYTINYTSTSQDWKYLLWDLGDGTIIDGRNVYYEEILAKGGELTEEQTASLENYHALLTENGGNLEHISHEYKSTGTYTCVIYAINPIGYKAEGEPLPYDGFMVTNQTGFDGGLSAGITPATYNPDDTSVSGSWDRADVTVTVMGYPTITFDSNGGSAVEPKLVVNTNVYVSTSEPDAPVREGYTFAGWYMDETLETPYDWNNKVTEPITLYAKWILSEDAVAITVDGKEVIMNKSNTVADIVKPTIEGGHFDGWYADAEYTIPVSDSDALVTGMTLYAKFSEVPPSTASDFNWIPYVVCALGVIIALVGLRFHPVILIIGGTIAVVGGLDIGGIVDIF